MKFKLFVENECVSNPGVITKLRKLGFVLAAYGSISVVKSEIPNFVELNTLEDLTAFIKENGPVILDTEGIHIINSYYAD